MKIQKKREKNYTTLYYTTMEETLAYSKIVYDSISYFPTGL